MTCRPKALVVVVVDGRLLMRTGRFGSNKLRKEPSKNVLVSVSTQEPIWSFLPCSFNAFHVLLCAASYPNSIGVMGRLWKKTNLLSACLAVCLSWMSVCWTELNHTTGKRRRARDVCVCVCVCVCVWLFRLVAHVSDNNITKNKHNDDDDDDDDDDDRTYIQ